MQINPSTYAGCTQLPFLMSYLYVSDVWNQVWTLEWTPKGHVL